MAGGCGHQRGEFGFIETGEVDAFDVRLAAQLRERLGERRIRTEFGVSVRADRQHSHRLHAREFTQHRQRRGIGPVQVVEHECNRADVAEHGEQSHGGAHDEVPIGLRVGLDSDGQARDPFPRRRQQGLDLGQLRGAGDGDQLGGRLAHHEVEGFDERLVRNAQAAVAAPVEHQPALLLEVKRDLGCQGGLPDAGFAPDQRQLPFSALGFGGERPEAVARSGAADEHASSAKPRWFGEIESRLEDGRIFVRRRGWQLVVDEPVHEFGSIEVPQLPHAEFDQMHALGKCVRKELRSGRADEGSVPLGDAAQPGGAIHGAAVVVAVAFEGFTGVEHHPDREWFASRPVDRPQRASGMEHCERSIAGAREHTERRVSFAPGLEQHTTAGCNDVPHHAVVFGECGAHGLGFTFPDASGAHDVGEEEGRDARGEDDVRGRSGRRVVRFEQIGALVEDRLFELDQLGGGVDAELVGQQLPNPGEGAQRIGLAPGPVQAEHEVRPKSFVQRVLRDQAVGFGHDSVVIAEREPRDEQVVTGAQPQLAETFPRRMRPLGISRVRVRLAPPPGQCRFEDVCGRLGLRRRHTAPARDLVLELDGVDRVIVGHHQAIAALGPGLDAILPDRPAQIRDVALDGLGCRGRRSPFPEVFDQASRGDDGVGIREQPEQQAPTLGAVDLQLPIVATPHLERPQDPELHLSSP